MNGYNWNSGEPNNSGGEYTLQFIGTGGNWNDLNGATNTSVYGYLVTTNLASSALTINAGTGATGGTVTFGSTVGGIKALASLNVNGKSLSTTGGVVTNGGTITFNTDQGVTGNNAVLDTTNGGSVANGAAINITNATNGSISFTGTTNFNAGTNNITIQDGPVTPAAGTGAITLGGLTGNQITIANNLSSASATNTNNVTLNGAITASGPIAISSNSGDITVAASKNITSNSAVATTAILSAGRDIIMKSASGITASTTALDLTMLGAQTFPGTLDFQGTTAININTKGGVINLFSGQCQSGSGATCTMPLGTLQNGIGGGIEIYGTTLNSGGGNIGLYNNAGSGTTTISALTGADSNTPAYRAIAIGADYTGLGDVANIKPTTINAGSGTINISGNGYTGYTSGVTVNNSLFATTGTGKMNLYGTSNGALFGIEFGNGAAVNAGGDVVVNGTTSQNSSSAYGVNVAFLASNAYIYSASGNMTLQGTAASASAYAISAPAGGVGYIGWFPANTTLSDGSTAPTNIATGNIFIQGQDQGGITSGNSMNLGAMQVKTNGGKITVGSVGNGVGGFTLPSGFIQTNTVLTGLTLGDLKTYGNVSIASGALSNANSGILNFPIDIEIGGLYGAGSTNLTAHNVTFSFAGLTTQNNGATPSPITVRVGAAVPGYSAAVAPASTATSTLSLTGALASGGADITLGAGDGVSLTGAINTSNGNLYIANLNSGNITDNTTIGLGSGTLNYYGVGTGNSLSGVISGTNGNIKLLSNNDSILTTPYGNGLTANGVLSVSGANNYTGTTTIAQGTLIANNANALGANSAAGTTVTSGGTLLLNNILSDSSKTGANAAVTLNGGTLQTIGNAGLNGTLSIMNNTTVSTLGPTAGATPGTGSGTCTGLGAAGTCKLTLSGVQIADGQTLILGDSAGPPSTLLNIQSTGVISHTGNGSKPNLIIHTAGNATIGNIGSAASPFANVMIDPVNTVLSDITADTINITNITNSNAGLSTASSVTLNGTLTATGGVSSSAPSSSVYGYSTPLLIVTNKFINNGGNLVASAANSRWLVWSTDPTADTRTGLTYGFKQYGATYTNTMSNLIASEQTTSRNGFVYSITGPTLTLGLTGTVSKTYNANNTAAIDNSNNVATTNYSVTGLINGDTLDKSQLPNSGTYDPVNVGTNKQITVTNIPIAIETPDLGSHNKRP